MSASSTRSKDTLSKQAKSIGALVDALPRVEQFSHKQLPLLSEVISLVIKQQDNGTVYSVAISSVSRSLVDHWTQRNVYTIAV